MERFEVAGSTLVYWTMRVEAHDEREAAEEAQKIAGWVEIPSSCAELGTRQHRVLNARRSPSPQTSAELSPPPQPGGRSRAISPS